MGSYLRVEDGGSWDDATGDVRPVLGIVAVQRHSGRRTTTPGDPSAGAPTSTLASTSSLLHTEAYDDFSEVIGSWQRSESGPFSPHSGTQYLYSGHGRRGLHAPLTGRHASRRAATRPEVLRRRSTPSRTGTSSSSKRPPPARTTGRRCPTRTGTRPRTPASRATTDTGWGADLHSRLLHYQTKKGDSCTPSGTTGDWNAATGSSGGWQDWTVDLSAYAGQDDRGRAGVRDRLGRAEPRRLARRHLAVRRPDRVGFEDGTSAAGSAARSRARPTRSTWGARPPRRSRRAR